MLQQVLDEDDVGGHAADAEFAQRAIQPGDGVAGGLAQAVTFSSRLS
ncbi:MAG: hypothetical protein KatS3mg118_0711 [Paracoccaceae bacterium]|nr:MAG: hypothetical protein KatS3mg118_0711 [Paracoccaceae bacterium]